jgi:hypothetical protein
MYRVLRSVVVELEGPCCKPDPNVARFNSFRLNFLSFTLVIAHATTVSAFCSLIIIAALLSLCSSLEERFPHEPIYEQGLAAMV